LRGPYSVDAGACRIRKVESRDLPEIVGINRKSFVLPYSSSVFREFYRDHRYAFLVAEIEGVIAGYSMSRILKRLNLRGFGVKRIGHIMSIAVHPDYRRMGIGKELLGSTMKILWEKDATEVHLEVRVSNQLARDIYKSFGFAEDRILEGYYSDGEDGILMVKKRE
jgi:ribosomal-protein-alanine N-acetyltransferase